MNYSLFNLFRDNLFIPVSYIQDTVSVKLKFNY